MHGETLKFLLSLSVLLLVVIGTGKAIPVQA
jgi:hypothetical protein